MPIEFTHVPGKVHPAGTGSTVPFFYDFAETATRLTLIEDVGFRRVVVDDQAGLLTNMDLAAPVSYTHLDVYKRQALTRACVPDFVRGF